MVIGGLEVSGRHLKPSKMFLYNSCILAVQQKVYSGPGEKICAGCSISKIEVPTTTTGRTYSLKECDIKTAISFMKEIKLFAIFGPK